MKAVRDAKTSHVGALQGRIVQRMHACILPQPCKPLYIPGIASIHDHDRCLFPHSAKKSGEVMVCLAAGFTSCQAHHHRPCAKLLVDVLIAVNCIVPAESLHLAQGVQSMKKSGLTMSHSGLAAFRCVCISVSLVSAPI